MDFEISINGKKITDGDKLPIETTIDKPKFKFRAKKDVFYTIIMVDPDAPYPTDAKFKYFVHWIVVNIASKTTMNDDDINKTILKYEPPHPPKDSAPHRYCFFLFEQKNGKIDTKNIIVPVQRQNFSLTGFTTKYNLEDISSTYFLTGHELNNKNN